MNSNPRPVEPGLLDVDFANAFLLTNGLDLVSNFVPESDMVRNRFDENERRRSVRSVELDVFNAAESIDKRLLRFDIFHAIQFEGVGHLAKNALGRFQSFAGELVNPAFRLEITPAGDKDWHCEKDQNVRSKISNLR